MESERSGKTISRLRFCKNKVIIFFKKDDKLEISNDTFSSFYLFKGKTLTFNEIEKIKHQDELNVYLNYAFKAINASLMTIRRLKEKLYAKNASKEIVEEVILFLKRNEVISDEGYIEDYLCYADEKLYGQNKIVEKLIQKGIDIDDAKAIKFSKNRELKKAKQMLLNLENRYKKYSYSIRKQKIYNILLSQGFTIEIALEAIKGLKTDSNDKLTMKELKALIKAWCNRNEHKYNDKNKMFQALFMHLKAKGYKYTDIKKAWEEYYEFDD